MEWLAGIRMAAEQEAIAVGNWLAAIGRSMKQAPAGKGVLVGPGAAYVDDRRRRRGLVGGGGAAGIGASASSTSSRPAVAAGSPPRP
jgi:hypothetical protein